MLQPGDGQRAHGLGRGGEGGRVAGMGLASAAVGAGASPLASACSLTDFTDLLAYLAPCVGILADDEHRLGEVSAAQSAHG